MAEIVEIFVYPNGYATRMTDQLVDCYLDEPDVFKRYEVPMEEYLLYEKETHICVDGKPQPIETPSEEEEELLKRKAEYDKERKNLESAFNTAMIEGDEELMNEIREDLKTLKEEFMEVV